MALSYPNLHKEGEHLSSQAYVGYWAGGRGCQNGEEGSRRVGVVEVPRIKRDGDGLMAAEADGESHLPWRRI